MNCAHFISYTLPNATVHIYQLAQSTLGTFESQQYKIDFDHTNIQCPMLAKHNDDTSNFRYAPAASVPLFGYFCVQ